MAEQKNEGSFRRMLTTVQNTVQGLTAPPQGSTALQQQQSIKDGWLRKQGGIVKSWHSRWFALKGDQLYYYSSQDESKQPLGTIFLPGNKVVDLPNNPNEPDKYLFEVIPGGDRNRMTVTHETYPICASSDEERKSWVLAIKKVMFAPKGGAIFGQSLDETMAYDQKTSKRKVPEVVEMCIDYLVKHGMDVEGIFRLPGRSSVIRKLREDFDCGERPQLSLPEVDVHSVASLLKLFLREMPSPLIPVKLYEKVMKIVTRDFHQNPEDAIIALGQLLQGLPHHQYNLLQYLCRFLSEVEKKSNENKMTAMNLATVFVQNNIIQPEDDDAVLLMGTANGRTQVTFVLITHCDQLFKVDYNEKGTSIPVDNLLDIEMHDTGFVSDTTVSSKRQQQTASFLLDLEHGTDLPCPLAPMVAPKENDLTSPCDESPGESEQPSLGEEEFHQEESPSSSENLSNAFETEQFTIEESSNPPAEGNTRNSSSSPETDSPVLEAQTSPSSGSPKVLKPTRPAPVPRGRSSRKRIIPPVHEGVAGDRSSVSVGQYEITRTSRPLRAPPPPPPARPTEPPKVHTPTDTTHMEATTEDRIVSDGLRPDLSQEFDGHTRQDLISEIIRLRGEVNEQKLEVKKLQSNESHLREQQKQQVLDLSIRLEAEQTATAQSVQRIMDLQKKLQKYAMKHGQMV